MALEVEDSKPHKIVHSLSAPAFDSTEFATENELASARCSWLPRWVPTSGSDLAQAEARLLKAVGAKIETKYVPVSKGQIWTAIVTCHPVDGEEKPTTEKTPLVMLHGFGGGLALWMHTLNALCAHRTVYIFDLLGFGRSSRPKFSADAGLVELEWVQSLEDWREQLGIEKMILLGHSLGGFIVSSYALEYPQHVRHLILADPWGFPPKPPAEEITFRGKKPTRLMRTLVNVFSRVNPLAGVRVAGPLGPRLVRKVRPDLGQRYKSEEVDEDTIFNYIYHCNAQKPSGETAFRQLLDSVIWAKRPMRDRLIHADPSLPISFLYGEITWMDRKAAEEIQTRRAEHYVTIDIVEKAGHQLFADNPDNFSEIVTSICALVDTDADRRT